jgi:uncharacterized protein (TIRG00374 family)
MGGQFLFALGWILLNWAIAIGQHYLLLTAFLPDAKPLWAAFGLAASALGIAAPSSPGAVGLLELSLVGALSLFQVDPSVALAFALTVRFTQYLPTSLLGGYALANDGESLLDLYRKLRRVKSV